MRDLVHVVSDAPDLGADALKLANDRPLLSVPSRLVNVAGLSGRLGEETRQRDATLFGQTGEFARVLFVHAQRDDARSSCACLGLLPSRHANLPSSICKRQPAPTAQAFVDALHPVLAFGTRVIAHGAIGGMGASSDCAYNPYNLLHCACCTPCTTGAP